MQIPFPLSTYDGKVTKRRHPNELWVGSGDLPTNIARNIVSIIDTHGSAYVAVIGSEAINQFVKGLAVAREMRREKNENEDIYTTPHFSVIIDAKDQERTRIVFNIFPMRDEDVLPCSVHQEATLPNHS